MATAASDTPTVSIVSLLADRRHFIPLLRKCVQLQTYPKDKIEWIIVDDGQTSAQEEFDAPNEIHIQLNKKFPLGRKRQLSCDLASGEFIFFFDDDDLHFPHRIERGVSRLRKTGSKMIAGNSALLLADVKSESVIQSGPFDKNHATAGTFAFRKEYMKHSSFRMSDTAGEEVHFLKNWSIPIIQMHPQDSIIALSHVDNTVSKEKIFEKAEIKCSLGKLFGNKEILKSMRDCLQSD